MVVKKLIISYSFLCFLGIILGVSAEEPRKDVEKTSILYPVIIDSKWGMINDKGQVVIKPTYRMIGHLTFGLRRVQLEGKLWGYMNEKGEMVIAPQYQTAMFFIDGLAKVRLNDRYGFIDTKGKVIIPVEYQDMYNSAKDGLIAAKKNGRWGFINRKNKTVIGFTYLMIHAFSEGLAAVQIKNADGKKLWGYIDTTGKWVIQPTIYRADPFEHGVANVEIYDDIKKRNTHARIDKTGAVLLKTDAEIWAYTSIAGHTSLLVDGLWNLVNEKNEVIIGHISEEPIENFSDGLLPVKIKGRWGFVNIMGIIVIEPQYRDIGHVFSEGLVAVKIGSKWGFIDTKGRLVIKDEFDASGGFNGEMARIFIGGNTVYINKKGEQIWPKKK